MKSVDRSNRRVRYIELQEVVSILVESNTSFAIRSGGHSPSPWAANIDGGVLIDLSNFSNVEYDPLNHVAIVGSAQTWGNVYTHLDPYNVTVVGGRVLSVGVGGLTLGSGLSYISDLYGLACDNVVNFEVVLANGTLVNANTTNNSDLFWALKGGGNNFGIVTAFTLSTYPIKNVWAGVKQYTIDKLPALHHAMYEYQSVANKDPYANLDMQGFVTNASVGILLSLVYAKPVENPPAFAPFYNITTTSDTTGLTTFTEFLTGQGPPSFPPRADWFTTSFEPSVPLYTSLNRIVTNSSGLKEVESLTAGTIAFGMQPISISAIEAGKSRGGNVLGLSPINQTWYVIDAGWWCEDDDTTAHTATRDIISEIEVESTANDRHLSYLFMNDASWDQPVIEQCYVPAWK